MSEVNPKYLSINNVELVDKRFSISQAALLLDISRNTLQRIIQRGEIGYILIGKRKYIPQQAIDDYLTITYDNSLENINESRMISVKSTACGTKRTFKSGDREYPLGIV